MKPKDKANELVSKYSSLDIEYSYPEEHDGWSDSIYSEMNMSIKESVKCALIAVEELIIEERTRDGHGDYWSEVKNELLKLNS